MRKAVAVITAIAATWLLPVRDASAQCAAKSTVCSAGLCCDPPYSYCCANNMCGSSSTCTGSLKCPSNAVQCPGFCCPQSAPTCCNGTCSSSPSCSSGKGGSGGSPTGNGGSPGASGTGCDGDKQKGVLVPCAGIDFCTCADHCTKNSDCVSDCCDDNLCVPACVCDGKGSASECHVGDSAIDPRESESGGCSIVGPTDAHGAGFALLALLGLRGLRGTFRRVQRRRDEP